MALTANEVIRNGHVIDETTGALSVAAPPVVAVVNGWPVDADGRLVVV